ncbi:MAG TPA: helix-turn-helix transcriptional regulator [Anaerolineaceae bacterium]|nr:helix-turn-helix transcriptional regulator [Anaerolineaceae bacterium]
MDETHDLADFLHQALAEAGISQSELARRAGVSKQVVSDYLRRKRTNPDPKVLVALAQALRLAPEALYRAAGLLPDISMDEAQWETFRANLERLKPEGRRRILKVIELEIEMQ